MDHTRLDVTHAVRMFARKPLLTLTVIATLAIGIGASTAIFSVLYVTLLKPLPYPDANRLCVIWTALGKEGRAPASGPELLSLRERNRLFEQVAGIWVQTGALTGRGEPLQVRLGWVTSNFLSLLASRPRLGRFFLPQEQGSGRAPVVILSNDLWQTRYGSDPAVVGHSILMNGRPFTVVGILPPGFRLLFPDGAAVPPQVDVYSPFQEDLARLPRDQDYIRLIATLQRGVSVQSAQSQLGGVAAQLRAEFHEYSEQDLHLQVLPLQRDATSSVRVPLVFLFAGSSLVLLIVCANTAILFLTRARERLAELSLRAALGAEPGRIMSQLLTESILLSCIGGCAGVGLSFGILKVLWLLQPSGIARNTSISVSLPALCFAVLVSIACGVLFGLSPALMAREARLASLLRQGSRAATATRHRFGQILIAGEVALTFVILTCAILLVTTFLGILHVSPGFQAANVLTFRVSFLGERYPTPEVDREFLVELQRRLYALPGVLEVGFASHLPFDDALPNWYDYVWRDGAPKDEQNTLMADHRAASPDFFNSLGVQLILGRNFDTSDEVSRHKVAIIDDSLARQLWPGQSAAGKLINVEIQSGDFGREVAEVIGVVRHVDSHSLTLPERGQVYLPYRMAARNNMYFVVRTRTSPMPLIPLIRRQVASLDRELPVAAVRLMSDYVLEAQRQSRFVAVLAEALAGIAVLLASMGIYGVTASSVTGRTREMGIRMVLGALPGHIVSLASNAALRPIVAGTVAGLGLSFAVTPMLSSLLFGVRAISLPILTGALGFLAAIAIVAIMIPTVRVVRNDPIGALRCE
jgi:putative ABC transport system permease protein